jgi:small conductance mechanosensitive channel
MNRYRTTFSFTLLLLLLLASNTLAEQNGDSFNRQKALIHGGLILGGALLCHIGANILAWLVNLLAASIIRSIRPGRALPTIKRVQTLVQFARSIVKLLIWLSATVTILNAFGISPGQSAGALGVIGLVLAGMFQQLVIDFVKGIDIAIGGHYFVGDFVKFNGAAGHVLDFQAKYTTLRTLSGQVVTLPNSQCIPSQRFPAGYVDNYVEIPLSADANESTARRLIDQASHQLNARVEAVKEVPQIIDLFQADNRQIFRVRVRVLPTCDWVITDHFIPMLKRQLESAGVGLTAEPTFFYMNDVETFRRLFNRKMTDEELVAAHIADSRPTIERQEKSEPQDSSSPET